MPTTRKILQLRSDLDPKNLIRYLASRPFAEVAEFLEFVDVPDEAPDDPPSDN